MIPAIMLEDVSVYINKKNVLRNITINIPKSKITVILGPSGSGKSTLLRTINRLIELMPNVTVDGKIRVFGRNIYEISPYSLRRIVGMVFQTPNPFPHLSIYENVAIAAKINKVAKNKEELKSIVKDSLKKAMLWDEVKDRLNDRPFNLSGGQQQRLCLARALAMKPKILLLDEPTANIDAYNTLKIEEVLKRLVREEKITIVVVTHMVQQAKRIADYVVILYNGEIVEFGPARKVFTKPSNVITMKLLRGDI